MALGTEVGSGVAGLGNVELKVTPEELTTKAQEVKNKIATMQAQFNELERLMTKTGAYWIGEAGDYHRKMYTDLAENEETVFARLNEHPVDLVTIAQQYTSTELTIESIVEELPGDILF